MFITFVCLRYNANAHPIPFHKAQDLGKAPKKIAAEPAPDCEEAYNVSFYYEFKRYLFDLYIHSSRRTIWMLSLTMKGPRRRKVRMTLARTN